MGCAAKNAALAGVKVETRVSNLFAQFRPDERFDIVFWNIPWTPADMPDSLSGGTVLAHGIFGGRSLLQEFLSTGAKHLTPVGSLMLVICLDSDGSECMSMKEFERISSAHGWTHETERRIAWSAQSALYLKRLDVLT